MEKQSSKQVVPQLFGTRGWFPGKKIFHKPRWGGVFWMIRDYFFYCALYFYYYYIVI